ncbi:hypothetical protein Q1695_010235 [Nippostrongylus brasiliensis]|nr:hypothetical protein Q1695_010235 [Nippostrongylus brasiliensis]
MSTSWDLWEDELSLGEYQLGPGEGRVIAECAPTGTRGRTSNLCMNISWDPEEDESSLASQEATDGPSWAPTGKLNQFRGYVTPRPLPPNAEFVYSSIWAAWSAWSFCNNGVKIRVRACNTVRGFSCLGKNQEFMPCDTDAMATSSRNLARLPSDYDVVDPYEADRREAMRQLYPDDFAAATEPAQQQQQLQPDPDRDAEEAAPDGTSDEAAAAADEFDSTMTTTKPDEAPELILPQVSSVTSTDPTLPYLYPWLEDPNFDENFAKGMYTGRYGQVPQQQPWPMYEVSNSRGVR